MPNSISIIIDTSQLEQLADGLTDAVNSDATRDLINKIIEKELLDSTDRAFKNETDPNTGEKWPEWAPSYVRSLMRQQSAKTKGKGKGRKGNAPVKMHKKLQLKGMQGGGLRSTIQTEIRDDAVVISGGKGIGSNLRYARIHQLGGMAGRGHRSKIPARPYLGMDQKSKDKVIRKITKTLIASLTKGNKP